MPGFGPSGYTESFNYGEDVNLDPSLLLADEAFGNMLDEFVTDQVAENAD